MTTNLTTFSAAQWSDAFTRGNELPLPERIGFWAEMAARDTVYVAGPLGEGEGKLPDTGPLHDFRHVDCVTFVEQVYALALSHSRAEFDEQLRRIRYQDGQVDYRRRNHYTVSDWLPANAWFIRDITAHVGATQEMTKTISRAHFFAAKGLTQYADIPDETATTSYLPRAQAATLAGQLRTGDLIIFVVATPGIIAGHVGLIRMQHGVAYLQHAGMAAKKVVTVPLRDYLRTLPERFVGFKIARPYLIVTTAKKR